ncbi:LptF/LptG family permease [Candidatus Pelagibacter communis]|uniref:LptF/LptG family permease n=1 Tax=Pelagibacter ubique TaxID=198252 RepID=UPI00094CBB7F|nr:LptF/LptG family permease [Candidatus Pelagibacter ubique]
MKKIIFKNFLSETTIFFLLSCSSVALIVWVIQAVNYLGFVTEDGHGFKIYFLYTVLSLPKIFNELLPFMFFFSVFFVLSKYEDQNQILIFWSNGIKKNEFLNVVIKYSFIFLILHLLMSSFVVPFTQDKARSYIRQSNIDFLPSLMKPKKFMDTVERLTIYVEDKNDQDNFENIVIKDEYNKSDSRIIYAKKGFFSEANNQKILVLNDGKILNINKGKTTIFNFNKTQINLSQYNSKTTKYPKLQEINIFSLSRCLFSSEDKRSTELLQDKNLFKFQCSNAKKPLDNIAQEVLSRIFKSLYIPLLGLISCLLIIKTKNSSGYSKYKIKIFALGIILISISEILMKFFSSDINQSSIIISVPLILFLIFRIMFSRQSMAATR